MKLATSIALVLLASAQLGADCQTTTTPHEVSFYPITSAPIGRVAAVTEDDPDFNEVRGVALTRGVAVAVRCWDSCDYVCAEPTITSSDPAVVRVAPLARQGVTPEHTLIAVKAGTATLTVRSRCADKTYPVVVSD